MDLSLPRRVEAEILDDLAADDPRARRSRDDLRRIHHFMATLSIIRRGLDRGTAGFVPRTLLELGAGDGSMLLRLGPERLAQFDHSLLKPVLFIEAKDEKPDDV